MESKKLTQAERQALLQLARATIEQRLDGKTQKQPEPSDGLALPAGAFVTLHKGGHLRGCIGTFSASRPLATTVREMAVAASTQDPRFDPVEPGELADLDIEISVLSPMRDIQDPAEIEVGRHGIYITRGFYSGVLLPQVATEEGWDRQTFLQHTCLKAGLPSDAWKDPKTRIQVFEAEVFGEK